MGNTFYFDWEVKLIVWIQSFIGDMGAQIASAVSILGEEFVLVLMLGFIYWCYDKEFGKFIGINILVGLVLGPMIKNFAFRRRPYMDHETIECLKPVKDGADIMDVSAQGFSCPSAHATNAAIIYGTFPIYLKNKKFIIPAVVLTFLIGLSRVMLGVHYPTDVILGWIIGTIIVFAISYFQKKVKNKAVLYGVILGISLLGLIYCRTEDYFTGLGLMIGLFSSDFFERRYVNFKNTRHPVEWVLRIIGGFATYLSLNAIMKAPFSKEFLDTPSAGSFGYRVFRYAVIGFAAYGLYPMLFNKFGRVFNKNESGESKSDN